MDDGAAAAASLANHALRSVVGSKNATSHLFGPIPRTRGNVLGKPSLVFVNRKRLRFLALYCVSSRALELFRSQTPLIADIRADFKRWARGYAVFSLDTSGNVVGEGYEFTVRAAKELIRVYGQPLNLGEQGMLRSLLSNEAMEPAS